MGVLPWIMTSLGVKGNELGPALEPQISVPPTPDGAAAPPSPFRTKSTNNEAPLSIPQTYVGPPPPPSPKTEDFAPNTSSPNSPTISSS